MRFYRLSVDHSGKKRYGHPIGLSGFSSEKIDCNVCGREWSNFNLNDLHVSLSNDIFPDFSRFLHYVLVSVNAKQMMIDEKINMFTLKQATVVSKSDLTTDVLRELRHDGEKVSKISDKPPEYYVLGVEEGARLHEQSGLIKNECVACGYVGLKTPGLSYLDPDHPLFIDTSSWTGNELFRVPHLAIIFCTDRFVELYHKYNLGGLIFREVGSV